MNCILNDRGGITYASNVRITGERRHPCLSEMRMVIDALVELGDAVTSKWPDGVEMPHELAARLEFNRYVVQRVRAGTLRSIAEVIEA